MPVRLRSLARAYLGSVELTERVGLGRGVGVRSAVVDIQFADRYAMAQGRSKAHWVEECPGVFSCRLRACHCLAGALYLAADDGLACLHGLRDDGSPDCADVAGGLVEARGRRTVGSGLTELCRGHPTDVGVGGQSLVGKPSDASGAVCEVGSYPADELAYPAPQPLEVVERGSDTGRRWAQRHQSKVLSL